jgi:pyridinium-3,5-biscarboxylic acid mononucleotide synthase
MPQIIFFRVLPEMYNEINTTYTFQNGRIEYNSIARIITMHSKSSSLFNNPEATKISNDQQLKRVVVATAGTTDITVAEEAAVTLEASGVAVDRIYDVGVAGLHRIISALPKLTHPTVGCIIVCAGMDGALPSVVGGLVQVPVIAVPTSVGYGAAFHGVSALLTMLNSCAPGVGVVNIDNGFGAAALAYKCLKIHDRSATVDESLHDK